MKYIRTDRTIVSLAFAPDGNRWLQAGGSMPAFGTSARASSPKSNKRIVCLFPPSPSALMGRIWFGFVSWNQQPRWRFAWPISAKEN